MSGSEAERISIRLLHGTKATASVLVDNKLATCIPPILCASCKKVRLHDLLRPEGFVENELKEAIARSDEHVWILATVRQSAARCRLCQLLLKCLEGCKGFDAAGTSEVFVKLDPIADYQELGELTFWMMMTGKRPRRMMEEFIRCQLKVGLRMRQDIEDEDSYRARPREKSSNSGNCNIITDSLQEDNLDAVTKPSSSAFLARDLSPPKRVETGFIFPNPSRPLSYATCERELSLAPGSLSIMTTRKLSFERSDELIDDSFDACMGHEGARSGIRPASTIASHSLSYSQERPPGSGGAQPTSSGLEEQISSSCIRLLGRPPIGIIDQTSWRYEVENIMKSRRIDASHPDFRIARYWLLLCGLRHKPFCPPLVWTAPKSSTFSLRVIDVKNQCLTTAPARCKYAALSYTWGTAEQYKLTQENFGDMCKPGGLREVATELPKTIADALVVCQNLYIRYLWVDALCIIQDSPSDKDSQIGSMSFVYGGAHLTIVAAFGNAADAGLPGVSFARKDPYFQCRIGDLDFITTPANEVECLLRSPWYTRGWTFQEMVLSKRILAFTEEQMLFFCVRAFFQEDMFLETVNGILHRAPGKKDIFDRHIAVPGYETDKPQNIFINQAQDEYQRFLTSYLNRELSDEGDILNAFAGILDALTPYLGAFRWGIPTSFPERVLTWSYRDSTRLQRRSGFPSWSWAGWKGHNDNLQFHKTDSDFYRVVDPDGPFFYSFLENGQIIPFGHVHKPDPEIYSETPFITDEAWSYIRPNFGQYLLVTTRTYSLAVDVEATAAGILRDDNSSCSYSIRCQGIQIGHIHLNQIWRRRLPAQLEFISVASSGLAKCLMLIQRSGPVAYRVQMVDKPINNWMLGRHDRVLQSIILG